MDALTRSAARKTGKAVRALGATRDVQDAAKVSVLLPTFNRAAYLAEAIASVLAQSHPPHELIVLDDGSTDATAQVCAGFGAAVRYVPLAENRGKSAALNRGLELATGTFVWVMDDDDIAPPQALAVLLAPMLAQPSIGFTFGRLQKFADDRHGRRVFAEDEQPPVDPRPVFVRLMEDCFITGQPCTLIRRECLDAIGPIDESVLASVDYNILLQVARRFECADVGEVVLWQRQHFGARGPVRLRYRSQQRVQLWMAFDSRLLDALLPELALEEYLGVAPSAAGLTAVERRRAFFQKAVIAGRKNLWDTAAAALIDARAQATVPLDATDRRILSRMLGSRYGIDALIDDVAVQSDLAAAFGSGPLGKDIAIAVASMLPYWIGQSLRRLHLARAAATVVTLCRMAGTTAAMRLAFSVAARRVGARRSNV